MTACAGDIVAPEDEGEYGMEAANGAPWRDELSAEVWRRVLLTTTTFTGQVKSF